MWFGEAARVCFLSSLRHKSTDTINTHTHTVQEDTKMQKQDDWELTPPPVMANNLLK